MGQQLTTPETRQLREHEQGMAECIDSVFKFAEHARAIREDRLYRAEYKTFEDYCTKRWNLSYRYVNKQIEAAEAVEGVSEVETEMGTLVPKTVNIGSQLAKIDSIPKRADVWKEAVETAPKTRDGKPNVTAAHVAKTAKAMFPPAESNGEADAHGAKPVQQPLWMQFAAKHADALNHLTQAISAINWIAKQGEPAAYLAPVMTRIRTDYKQLRGAISQNCPSGEEDGEIRTKVQERKYTVRT